jgi:hypothetical protein
MLHIGIYLTTYFQKRIGFWFYLRFGYCDLEFICYLMLVICYFRFIRV